MLLKLNNFPDLPVQIDIVNHPPKRLKSRNPIWSLTQSNKPIEVMWANRQTNTNVQNHFLVSVPNRRVPDFKLNRAQWTTLDGKGTGQVRCNYLLYKWGKSNSPFCECGLTQTTSDIVEKCQITRFDGGVTILHNCGPTAIKWLRGF